MRNGDFSVEVIPSGPARVRELETGHVLARPGTVYRLRLRNLGPLTCVVDLDIDGRRVTAGGLVLRPGSTTDLERPLDDGEDGRFTVAAEGNERALGPDGGRDNDALGLIDARFRRELPPAVVPEFDSPLEEVCGFGGKPKYGPSRVDALMSPMRPRVFDASTIERAAGTGLTGHSDQRFEPVSLGPLEHEATVIRLRLVIGSVAAIAEQPTRPNVEHPAPARPAARP